MLGVSPSRLLPSAKKWNATPPALTPAVHFRRRRRCLLTEHLEQSQATADVGRICAGHHAGAGRRGGFWSCAETYKRLVYVSHPRQHLHSRERGWHLYHHTQPFHIHKCNHFHTLVQSRQEFASDFPIVAFSRAIDTFPVSSSSSHSTPSRPCTCGDSVFFHGRDRQRLRSSAIRNCHRQNVLVRHARV